MHSAILARRVVSLIENTQINTTTEAAAHNALCEMLDRHKIAYQTEFRLSATERIDLLVGGEIGVEVKTGHARRHIADQLNRYSEYPEITHMILATGRSWPQSFRLKNGKPLLTASLTRGWL